MDTPGKPGEFPPFMIRSELHLAHIVSTLIFALMAVASSGALPLTAAAAAGATPWVEGPRGKVRLLTGRVPDQDGAIHAFVQIALEPGWKTYWRTPGDAGGLPPSFDWSKSSNLAAADVAFPAPRRFTDRSGNTIGYENGVVLPIALRPQEAGQPISLVVGMHYGICKDICIPGEAELALEVPAAGATNAAPADALEALKHVPRPQDKLRPGDPVLVQAQAILSEPAPKILIEARFTKDDAISADAFLEAPDGIFLPLPERLNRASSDGLVVFEAPLGEDVDVAQLRGKTVTVTLVGRSGASVATFGVP